MRFYTLRAIHRDPRMKWVYFHDRRAWLDIDHPVCDITLQFAGPGAGVIDPVVSDRAGRPVAATRIARPQLPRDRNMFLGQPPENRQTIGLRLRFDGPQRLVLRDVGDGRPLLDLVPALNHPDFLFALLEEIRTDSRFGVLHRTGCAGFVETGTLFGHTTLAASYWFDRVTTIELSPDLHAQAARHLAHRPNIRCLQGDSVDVLARLIPDLPGPTLFFLDAHWSGDNSVDWQASANWGGYPTNTARRIAPDLGEAETQAPLRHELEAIAGTLAVPAVVVIDDWTSVGQLDRGFKGEDWRNLDRVALLDWFDRHPRTRFHEPLDAKRYLWVLDPGSDA